MATKSLFWHQHLTLVVEAWTETGLLPVKGVLAIAWPPKQETSSSPGLMGSASALVCQCQTDLQIYVGPAGLFGWTDATVPSGVPVYCFGRVLDAPLFVGRRKGCGVGSAAGCTGSSRAHHNVVVDNGADHTAREAFRDGRNLRVNVREPGGALPSPDLL